MPRAKLNLHELSDKDLQEKLSTEQVQYKKMRFNHTVNNLENPKAIKELRRDIARVKTEQTKRAKQAQAK